MAHGDRKSLLWRVVETQTRPGLGAISWAIHALILVVGGAFLALRVSWWWGVVALPVGGWAIRNAVKDFRRGSI